MHTKLNLMRNIFYRLISRTYGTLVSSCTKITGVSLCFTPA